VAASPQTPEDTSWEKQHAPHVTRRQVIFAAAIFCLWIAFLAILAAGRWFGSLQ
jgi:hypothetical protein